MYNWWRRFLDHLDADRGVSIRTQNQRLAMLHSFFRYVQSEAPHHLLRCQRILAIPLRRQPRKLVGYLSKEDPDGHPGTNLIYEPAAGRPGRGVAELALRHRSAGTGVDRPERRRRAAGPTRTGAALRQGTQDARRTVDGPDDPTSARSSARVRPRPSREVGRTGVREPAKTGG